MTEFREAAATSPDGISVIVPAHNAERFLGRCLASLLTATPSAIPFEVIVVENRCTDNTRNIAEEAGVRIIESGALNAAAARNDGARHARFSILAFLDSDCLVPPDWASKSYQLLQQDQSYGAVGGGCLAPHDGTWIQRAWAPSHPRPAQRAAALPGASFALRSDLFHRLSGFREDLDSAEDDDLSRRIRSQGLALLRHPDLWVTHLGYPARLLSFFRSAVSHGKTQLRANPTLKDGTLALTVLWFFSCVAVVVAAAVVAPGLAALALIFMVSCQASLAWRRVGGDATSVSPRRYLQTWTLAGIYLLGRSLGLITESLALIRLGMRKLVGNSTNLRG